jgi:hypothetical protein
MAISQGVSGGEKLIERCSRSFSKDIPGKIFYLPIDGGFPALY